jgi:DUF1707 SHOCT-like domain
MDAMTAPWSDGIRIGNEERAAAMKALDEHMSAGRLDPDEYGQRVAQVSVARTREGIEELFTDLPAPHPFGRPMPDLQQPAGFADWARRRYASESRVVRIAMLALATLLLLAILPFVAAGALLIFIVLPILARGGHPRARYWSHRRW